MLGKEGWPDFVSFQLFAEMHDPHFPFSRAKPLLPTLKFLILEYNMCSVKVWGKGMPLTTQPSYPLNASQSPSQWGSVLGSSPEAMSLHWVSACHLALGAIVSICHPRLYEEYSWVETNWIFPIERNLVRTGGPLKTNPASMAHTRSWLSTAPRSGCCRYAVCPVQCGLSTELRDELEGDMNFIFFQSGKDRTDCHKTSMVSPFFLQKLLRHAAL